MPLTGKGEEIKQAMTKQYGKEKGESVFYASRNAGKISGVDQQPGLATAPSAATVPPASRNRWSGRVI